MMAQAEFNRKKALVSSAFLRLAMLEGLTVCFWAFARRSAAAVDVNFNSRSSAAIVLFPKLTVLNSALNTLQHLTHNITSLSVV